MGTSSGAPLPDYKLPSPKVKPPRRLAGVPGQKPSRAGTEAGAWPASRLEVPARGRSRELRRLEIRSTDRYTGCAVRT